MPEPQFGSPDCTCIPWTRKYGTARYCGPNETVDDIAGWEPGRDCPHHAHPVRLTDRAALRDRIAEALVTTSRKEWPYTPGQEKWDHHQHGDRPGHTYSISCALCTNDVDWLADAVLAVLPEPADRAAILRAEADEIVAHCPDHGSADGVWMDCHCAVADDMRKRAAEAQQPKEA